MYVANICNNTFAGGYGKWNVLYNYEKKKKPNDKLVQSSMSQCFSLKMYFGLITTMGAEPTLHNPGNDTIVLTLHTL